MSTDRFVPAIKTSISVSGIVLVLLLAWFAMAKLPKILVARHMVSVTQSLESWARDYSIIKNNDDAFRCIEMLEYIRGYYPPGKGYRGQDNIEAALEKQRSATIHTLIEALEKYSGESCGTNQSSWHRWAEAKGYRRQQ